MKYHNKYLQEANGREMPASFGGALSIGWRSPSNIALVKYWGKKRGQIPMNPSLSITLDSSYSDTRVQFTYTGTGKTTVDFRFEGQANEPFAGRIITYLEKITPYLPFLRDLHLEIDSSNSFPHSSGIASSASAMSSLALCLVSAEKELIGAAFSEEGFFRKASFLARIGSGSASRSLYPGYVIWGEHPAFPGSDDEIALACGSGYHEIFRDMYDSVMIVSPEKKKVSSSAGHKLMDGHDYGEARILQANKHMHLLNRALREGDVEEFIRITELEALSLHGLMMSSDPGFMLLNDRTIAIIEKIREYRRANAVPVCFTLDAGPNVHLLYPSEYRRNVEGFIRQEIVPFCHEGRWIDDRLGKGPLRINQ